MSLFLLKNLEDRFAREPQVHWKGDKYLILSSVYQKVVEIAYLVLIEEWKLIERLGIGLVHVIFLFSIDHPSLVPLQQLSVFLLKNGQLGLRISWWVWNFFLCHVLWQLLVDEVAAKQPLDK